MCGITVNKGIGKHFQKDYNILMKQITSAFRKLIMDCKVYWVPLLLIVLYLLLTQWIFHASCPSVILFGLPCPACGLTRAGLLTLTGHFIQAAGCNPTVFLWGALVIYCGWNRYALNRQPSHCLAWAALIGICTLVWFVCQAAKGNLITVAYPGIFPCKQLLELI